MKDVYSLLSSELYSKCMKFLIRAIMTEVLAS